MMNFQERILGRVPDEPVTVDEVIERLQQFRGDALVELSRNMVTIKLAKEKRPEGNYIPLGFLDEPVPVPLRRNI